VRQHLSENKLCSKCGYANRSDAKFCGGCASSLSNPPSIWPYRDSRQMASSGTGSRPFQRPWWNSSPVQNKDLTSIGRTETGILLLAISLLLGPIPYLMYVGYLLGIIGSVLVILGRKAFGQFHSNLVKLSVGIWVLGIIVSILVGFSWGYDVATGISTYSSPASEQAFLISAFNDLIVGVFVSAAIIGIATVLITYALQTRVGRVLLITGYVLGLAIGVSILSMITSQVNAAVSQALSMQDFSALTNLQAQSQLLGLVSLIPATVSAFALYLAYSRVRSGEIPSSTTVPAWS